MRVISRQSTLQFRESRTPLQQIARTLGVDVVVEGSVLRAGDRVRVTVQLIQAAPERHLWAQSYDCAVADVLGLQRQLAASIATQVTRALQGDSDRPGGPGPMPAVHEAYLKGRFFGAGWTRDGLLKAVHQFERAVELDPAFAPAQAGLANAYALLGYWNHLPARQAYAQAKAAALRALALDDALSEAHAALSWVLLWQDWDLAGSKRARARAIALNPSNEMARIQSALDVATIHQDRDLALAEMREALRLDPLSVMTGSAAAWVLFFVREYERAAEQAAATLEMHPLSLQARYVLGLGSSTIGRHAEAIASLERAVEISPVPLSLAYLGKALAAAGETSRARAILENLLTLPSADLVSVKPLVVLHAALHETDRAFDCLERAFEARDTVLLSVLAGPTYDPLRGDPRFDRLVARIHRALGMAVTTGP